MDLIKMNAKGSEGGKNATFELKKLQQQMRQYALKEKKPCTSYFNFSNDTIFNDKEMSDLAEKEITNLKTKKRWKGLPRSIQWDLMKLYFETEDFKISCVDKDLEHVISTIKHALLSNKKDLIVSYDHESQRVIKITI